MRISSCIPSSPHHTKRWAHDRWKGPRNAKKTQNTVILSALNTLYYERPDGRDIVDIDLPAFGRANQPYFISSKSTWGTRWYRRRRTRTEDRFVKLCTDIPFFVIFFSPSFEVVCVISGHRRPLLQSAEPNNSGTLPVGTAAERFRARIGTICYF